MYKCDISCQLTCAHTSSATITVCCRDRNYCGDNKPRLTEERRCHQKSSRKLNMTCLSRMYADQHVDNTATVAYIPAHTGHKHEPEEHKFLPLPKST